MIGGPGLSRVTEAAAAAGPADGRLQVNLPGRCRGLARGVARPVTVTRRVTEPAAARQSRSP